MTKEITIKKEVSPIVKQVEELKIKSSADLVKATGILSKLNKYNDELIEDMEKLTKPINASLKVYIDVKIARMMDMLANMRHILTMPLPIACSITPTMLTLAIRMSHQF